ncbi:MAG: hypothetical protein OEW84_02235 [Aigarchaeota archaeon]|nr:hypothetical protein [Aigarchaeota archaeon]
MSLCPKFSCKRIYESGSSTNTRRSTGESRGGAAVQRKMFKTIA